MEVALQDSYSRMATCYHLLFEHAPKGADIYSLSEVNNDIVLGIDLHLTNNHLGIYDQDDRELLSKKLPNDLAVVLGYLEPCLEGTRHKMGKKSRARKPGRDLQIFIGGAAANSQ